MKAQLNISDRTIIQGFFEVAKEEYGGIARLFATPLSFSDSSGVVKFRFPEWMDGIRQYLISEYGYKDAGRLMLDLMAEWISEGRFQMIPNFRSEITFNDNDESESTPIYRKAN
jgi:hypothetical protein